MTPDPAPPLETLVARFWAEPALPDWIGCAPAPGGHPLRLGIAVSGGADSMALLWLLAGPARPAWAPEPVAMHVNHGLRGAEADADEQRVAALARTLAVPFRVRRLDGEALRRAPGGSLEAAARAARFAALRDIARRARCHAVALAHHEDDLAETLLIRLLRGSGLTGLAAFGPEQEIHGLRVVRPLIAWPRADVRRVAELAALQWAEDATNRDPAILRNRLRHELLPRLEAITDHPPAARMLARTARLLEREAHAVDAIARRIYAEHRRQRSRPRRIGLAPEALQGDNAPLSPYILRHLVMDAARSPYPPSEARLLELHAFARHARPGAFLQTERSLVAWIDPDQTLWLYRKTRRNIPRRQLLRIMSRPDK